MIIALWVLFVSLIILSVVSVVGLFRAVPSISVEGLAGCCALVAGAVIVGIHLLGHG